mgnify:CR=1 FL=1
MRIVRNRLLPFRDFDAINILGVLFCHRDTALTPELIRHERIHTAQMTELLVVGFYLWYLTEWLIRLVPLLVTRGRWKQAYRSISFEREAYDNMHDAGYLSHRSHYSWLRCLR